MLAFCDLIDFIKGDFVCFGFNHTFFLTLNPLGTGLPKGVVFDKKTPTIPPEVSTSSKSDPSHFHDTSAEDHALSKTTPSYSDSFIVYDKICKGNVSRVHIPFVNLLQRRET